MYINDGFKEIRRTYSPTLKVSGLVEYNLNIRDKYHIRTLEEVLSNEVLMGKLTHLVKRTYEKYAMEVLNNFPFAPSPTWITFQKE